MVCDVGRRLRRSGRHGPGDGEGDEMKEEARGSSQSDSLSGAKRTATPEGIGGPPSRWGAEVPDEAAPGPELHPYYSESWFTAEGARLKLRRLQRAGLPDFKDWRFVTLTNEDRNRHPREAYEKGKDRIRRFLLRVRKALGYEFKWCWKLEFHEDGFAHWHLLLEYTKRIPPEMLEELGKWWGLGRVNVRRVKRRDIFYVFKYVAKGVEDVPEWVAKHKGRLRVFQASRGFYTNRKKREAKRGEPKLCLLRVDLVTRQQWDARRALLVTVDRDGQRRVRAVKLRTTFNALLLTRAYESIRLRRQLAAPGVVNINQRQAMILEYEHKQWSGLAAIPRDAAAA